MRIKKDFELRRIAGENIVVATGVNNVNFSKIISMNSSSAYLWEEVSGIDNFEIDTLANLLVAKYDIGYELALEDSERISQAWIGAGIAE